MWGGGGCGVLQVQVVVNLVSPKLPMDCPGTKSAQNYALINLLFGLYRSVWVIKCMSFFLVPSWSFSTPFYPQSATSQEACFDSLFFCCFHFQLTFESIKKLGTMYTISDFSFQNAITKSKILPNIALMFNGKWFVYWSNLINLFWSPFCWKFCDKKLGHTIIQTQSTHILNARYTFRITHWHEHVAT
jgi:hypothetical protein